MAQHPSVLLKEKPTSSWETTQPQGLKGHRARLPPTEGQYWALFSGTGVDARETWSQLWHHVQGRGRSLGSMCLGRTGKESETSRVPGSDAAKAKVRWEKGKQKVAFTSWTGLGHSDCWSLQVGAWFLEGSVLQRPGQGSQKIMAHGWIQDTCLQIAYLCDTEWKPNRRLLLMMIMKKNNMWLVDRW